MFSSPRISLLTLGWKVRVLIILWTALFQCRLPMEDPDANRQHVPFKELLLAVYRFCIPSH